MKQMSVYQRGDMSQLKKKKSICKGPWGLLEAGLEAVLNAVLSPFPTFCLTLSRVLGTGTTSYRLATVPLAPGPYLLF